MESLTVLSFIKVQNDAVLANHQLHHGSIHSIKDFKDYKKLRPKFCSNLIKTLRICLRQTKNCPEIQRMLFPSNICKRKNVIVIIKKSKRDDRES